MKLTTYEYASKGRKEFGIYLAVSIIKAAAGGVLLFVLGQALFYGAGLLYLAAF